MFFNRRALWVTGGKIMDMKLFLISKEFWGWGWGSKSHPQPKNTTRGRLVSKCGEGAAIFGHFSASTEKKTGSFFWGECLAPLMLTPAPWRSSQSCVTGGQQPIGNPYRFLSFLLHTWQALCDPNSHSWGSPFQRPEG